MNNMVADLEPLVVKKLEGRQWCVEGIEDLPMSTFQMHVLIIKVLKIGVEEVAFMDLEFKENPSFTHAYFGINGTFMYCK